MFSRGKSLYRVGALRHKILNQNHAQQSSEGFQHKETFILRTKYYSLYTLDYKTLARCPCVSLLSNQEDSDEDYRDTPHHKPSTACGYGDISIPVTAWNKPWVCKLAFRPRCSTWDAWWPTRRGQSPEAAVLIVGEITSGSATTRVRLKILSSCHFLNMYLHPRVVIFCFRYTFRLRFIRDTGHQLPLQGAVTKDIRDRAKTTWAMQIVMRETRNILPWKSRRATAYLPLNVLAAVTVLLCTTPWTGSGKELSTSAVLPPARVYPVLASVQRSCGTIWGIGGSLWRKMISTRSWQSILP